MDLLSYVRGCTFDDFLLTPQCGVLPRRDPGTVDLTSRFSRHLTLKRPIVSANLDTVSRPAMAKVLADAHMGLQIYTAGTEGLLAVLGVPARAPCLDELIAGALRADVRTDEVDP